MKILGILVMVFFAEILFSCSQKKRNTPVIYNGPFKEIEDAEILYTENNLIKTKVKSGKIFELQSGDREFPEGIHVEFYENGRIVSILQSNSAYYFKKKKIWRGQGKVRVNNVERKQQLRTEELFWDVNTKRITTDKFVTINLEQELIYGTGLDAAQDLSDYTIKNPGGEFAVDN